MSVILVPLLASAADAAEGNPFPPFETWHMPSQLFWLAILFGGLYITLSRFILPRMADTFEKRANRIAADLDEAARLNNNAVSAQKALVSKLAEARARARETGEKALEKANAEITQESARVDAELGRKLDVADQRIDALREAAMKNVREIASQSATAITQRLGVKASAADVKKAVDAVLE